MSAIRSLQRMNAQKLSAGDQQVRHEMRQRDIAMRNDFNKALDAHRESYERALNDLGANMAQRIDVEVASRVALAERLDAEDNETLFLIAEIDAATNERLDRTISYRIVSVWRSLVEWCLFIAESVKLTFRKGGAQ